MPNWTRLWSTPRQWTQQSSPRPRIRKLSETPTARLSRRGAALRTAPQGSVLKLGLADSWPCTGPLGPLARHISLPRPARQTQLQPPAEVWP
eukprot:13804066-Alexandrium_andersonii.AAC.1